MTKIVLISDTHNYHRKITVPECDILIHAGDATSTGEEHQMRDFAAWLEQQPATHKLFVPGNHERTFERNLPLSKTWFEEECPSGKLLIHEYIEVEGLKMFFSPFTPTFYNWAFMRDRGRHIGVKWDDIPNGLDFLVTHGMPHGILDWTPYGDGHVGCEELLKAIYDKKPKHIVGGHLHSSGGMMKEFDGMKFYNAAMCNEQYSPTNPIHIIEI